MCKKLQLLVVDDHPLIASGIRQNLSDAGMSFDLFAASSGEQALLMLQNDSPWDLVFLDLNLPGLHGLDFLKTLKQKYVKLPVIVVSGQDQAGWVNQALLAGAKGFISKSGDKLEFVEAINALQKDQLFLSSRLRQGLDDFRVGVSAQNSGKIALTKRQRSVLLLVADGQHNKQISQNLGISESTVKGHVSTLFDLLEVDNRTACIKQARYFGLCD
ncbi:response regulator transcription factor [Paraglaciecola aquimarina]|uniref:Response regulator transcription factor n=1 Tax=Paraglaciecola algarum TaxID=3050085 RepID=A0ABS9D524_9ALTE|nr:response regulator transcription factor [Paraglaciecola sp. G1-23]MCF2948031.1 response regulator transcription factor [Paraglaciecola sp. G1-23]